MGNSWRIARDELRPLAAVTAALVVITALLYPLAVTAVGQAVFNRQANGSLLTLGGKSVGSSVIGQSFSGAQYFHGRPSSAGDGYDAAKSSGSNLGPTSDKLINGVHDPANPEGDFDGLKDRVAAFRLENGLSSDVQTPADAVTASASGLDPHVSPATARLQIARVARARGAQEADIRALVDKYTEGPGLGFIGQSRVNVLKLNIALDKSFPTP